MSLNLAQLAPYLYFVGAIVAIVAVFAVIRFFWHHILRYLLHGCLIVVGIIIVLALLHYFKIF